MQKIKKNLKEFYDDQADKFHNTRKKKWPEFQILLNEINKIDKKTIKILEIGCGS
jgi:ubiquinone/menaquinone biosynthesis C-methylase UbiE